MERKNNDHLMKHSNWAVQVVADQTGKSPFESMNSENFSEFLYSLFRYKNKDLFSKLATILNYSSENKWRIERLWHYICDWKPEHAAAELDLELLEKKPLDWDLESFRKYMIERQEGFVTEVGIGRRKNNYFGKAVLSAYEMHVKTSYFKNLLKDENLSVEEWHETLLDWRDIVDGMRSKNHFLKERVLTDILTSGIGILRRIIINADANQQINSENPLDLKNYQAYNLIFLEIKKIFEYEWHAFEQEKCTLLLNSLYTTVITLFRNDQKMCKFLGREFFMMAFGIRSLSAKYKNNPDVLNIAGELWGEHTRQEVTKQFA